jgi:hypothetical protein
MEPSAYLCAGGLTTVFVRKNTRVLLGMRRGWRLLPDAFFTNASQSIHKPSPYDPIAIKRDVPFRARKHGRNRTFPAHLSSPRCGQRGQTARLGSKTAPPCSHTVFTLSIVSFTQHNGYPRSLPFIGAHIQGNAEESMPTPSKRIKNRHTLFNES